MINIAVVEDEKVFQETLLAYLNQFQDNNDVKFNIEIYADGSDLLENYEKKYHIIFLDIEMPKVDGMTTAEVIRQSDKDVILIFITNMAEYAVKGYRVDAMSYLLKPIPYFAFSEELRRSLEKVKNRIDQYIWIPHNNNMMRLNVRDIRYIETYKHHILIQLKEGQYSYVGTMKEIECKLKDLPFYRCHNGYLVHLAFVTSVEDNDVILGQDRIPISRAKRKGFLQALTDYIGEMMA